MNHAGIRYGLLGLPLAFVALPLYVHLPHLYASQYGISLTTLGLLLLIARLFDAFTDPFLGKLSDQLFAHSADRVLKSGAVSAAVLITGVVLLFFPPWRQPDSPFILLCVLILTSLGFSMLAISHQSWGARLGGDEQMRARVVAWREGVGLIGVVFASVLPFWLSWKEWIMLFALVLVLGWWAWARSVRPFPAQPVVAGNWQHEIFHPWRFASFRRLMSVFVLSGMASAIPATLVLFFIEDRLNASELKPLFLSTYFIAAAASMPLWMRAVSRLGLARTWLLGMLLSIIVFVCAGFLSNGHHFEFWLVCVLSGLALGTDLALPGALLAGIISDNGDRGQREGSYFGWWNLAGKFNSALAAGFALPILDLLGYHPGATSDKGLHALTFTYAALPCALKLLSAICLYYAFVRSPRINKSTSISKEAQ